MRFFVCGDCGARIHFIANWLGSALTVPLYDVGRTSNYLFEKAHEDWGNKKVYASDLIRIRVRPGVQRLDLHLYLWLTKNVYEMISSFSRNPYDLETYAKVSKFANICYSHDEQIDNSQYDSVISFEDTFDQEKMCQLYIRHNGATPNHSLISVFDKINQVNQPEFDKNHACSVAAMIIKLEKQLGVDEADRLWSVPLIYQTTPSHLLYETIQQLIKIDNYKHN